MTGQIRATALIVGAVLAVAFVVEAMRPTQAMPNFSQAYSSNCELRHAVPPALNAYGRYVQRTATVRSTLDLSAGTRQGGLRLEHDVDAELKPSRDERELEFRVDIAWSPEGTTLLPSFSAHRRRYAQGAARGAARCDSKQTTLATSKSLTRA